jgi:pre-mRNA-splicing factor 38B
MSRSALNRQEGNVKERERRAEDLFENAVEEGRVRQRAKGVLPLWGPEDSFHLNPLLLRNIKDSPYFQKCCQNLNDWNAVVDDIYYQVQHVQPFQTAGSKTPSSAFCLLLRLFTLRMTEHQLQLMLNHEDSPYIRAVAFLYLRYAGPPEQTYKWIEPYLYDMEDIQVTCSGKPVPMGDFVRQLFSSREYHGTPLPRFPSQTERHLQVQLVAADHIAQRAGQHFGNQHCMQYFSRLGSAVMALYGDEDNPVTWYPGVVDRVVTRDQVTGHALQHPLYVVTFTEYGNTETVRLGEMDVLDGAWKHDQMSRGGGGSVDHRHGESGGHDRRGGGGGGERPDLYEEVRRRERETVVSGQRDQYARRPPTTKNSLAAQPHRRSHLQDDDYDDANNRQHRHNNKPPQSQQQQQQAHRGGAARRESPPAAAAPAPRKRTAEEMAMVAEKKRKLMSKYG